ncbi:MAG: TolC family protein [Candidatus Binatia bacterium]|nr:TolC family protein [Candidatus Binatia bacterium]
MSAAKTRVEMDRRHKIIRFRHLRRATVVSAALLTGCISANPAPDLARTADLASNRTGLDANLAQIWSGPWEDRSGGWDGHEALGIDAAVRGALQNDPALRRHLALVAERRADLSQASLPPNPIVAMTFGTALDGMAGAPFAVQAIQQLTWLWTMSDRIDAADAVLDGAVFRAAHRVVTTSATVRVTFARAMCMERLTQLNESYVKTTKRTLGKISELHGDGGASQVDLDRARMDASRASADYVNALRMYRSLQLELLRLIGRPEISTDWKMAGNLAATLRYDPPTEEDIEARATTVRLDLAAAARFRDAADAEASLAGWMRFPQVSLATGFRQNFSRRHGWMTGGALSIPIFDAGSAAIARAGARIDQAELSIAELRQAAITQARLALNEWLRAREQTKLYGETLVAPAKRVVASLQDADDSGEAYVTALLLAQRRMIMLERARVQEMLAGATAWVKLETAVGGSLQLPLEAPAAPAF